LAISWKEPARELLVGCGFRAALSGKRTRVKRLSMWVFCMRDGIEDTEARSSMNLGQVWDKRDLICNLVPGKTFADVGGLWGLHNEMVSVALKAGATSATMIDIAPLGHSLWDDFKAKLAQEGVADVPCLQGDACARDFHEKVGEFDVVHSSGIIYHVHNPIDYLLNLRDITKSYLIITSMTVPDVITNGQQSIDLSGGRFLSTHKLDGGQKAVIDAHFESLGLGSYNITDVAENLLGRNRRPDFGPWWWFFTAESLRRMISASGLEVIAIAETWQRRSHSFLCSPIRSVRPATPIVEKLSQTEAS